ncbi:TPA: hypothetical protein DCX16_01805 [bacterium]|nr:hypothetical protein [bacterium]
MSDIIAVLVFFSAFIIYLLTLWPTIPFHDCGDMVSSAYLLGIAHPTGYPLFSIIGKFWITTIPFGNIAYRMNALSSLFASLTCMMVYFITLKLATNTPSLITRIAPSIVASFVLAFSPTFWQQAIISEKYTLNALFFSLLIFVLLKWQETQSSKIKVQSYLYLFVFILGLSFCHHMQTIFIIPASIFLFITTSIKKFKLQSLKLKIYSSKPKTTPSITRCLLLTVLFLLPLLLYLYLPIRSLAHPWVNWGDPDRISGFLDYITAKGYSHYFEKSSVFDHIKRGVSHWKNHIPNQFLLLFFPSLIGFLLLFLKKRQWGIFFLFILLVNCLHCSHYNIPNVWDYYIPTYTILSISLGFLCATFFSLNKALSIACLVLISLPLYPFSKNLSRNIQARNYSYYDEGMGYLKPLKKDAIFLTKGDICFILWYLHYVENVRPDIFLINGTFLHTYWLMEEIDKHHPELVFNRDIPEKKVSSLELANIRFEKYREIMGSNSATHTIYTPFVDDITSGFPLIPEGFVQRVLDNRISKEKIIELARKAVFDVTPYQGRSKRLVNNVKNSYVKLGVLFSENGYGNDAISSFNKAKELDPNDKEVITNLSKCYYNLAVSFDQKGMVNDAESYYKKAIEVDPNMIDSHYNLGILYYHKKHDTKATIYYWGKVLEIDPKSIKAHENLAVVYYNMGRFKEAEDLCKKLKSFDPNNHLANNMLIAIAQR